MVARRELLLDAPVLTYHICFNESHGLPGAIGFIASAFRRGSPHPTGNVRMEVNSLEHSVRAFHGFRELSRRPVLFDMWQLATRCSAIVSVQLTDCTFERARWRILTHHATWQIGRDTPR